MQHQLLYLLQESFPPDFNWLFDYGYVTKGVYHGPEFWLWEPHLKVSSPMPDLFLTYSDVFGLVFFFFFNKLKQGDLIIYTFIIMNKIKIGWNLTKYRNRIVCGILSWIQSQIPQIFLAEYFSWTVPKHRNFPEIQAREYKKMADIKLTQSTCIRLKCFPLF